MFDPTGFSLEIFKNRYAFDENESWKEACQRVAKQIASAENPDKFRRYEELFFEEIVNNRFVPGGRILYGSGRPHPNLLNCFCLRDDLDSKAGWAQLAHDMILTSMNAGGCGCCYDDVRPKGASIKGEKGVAPGPIELMKLINGCGDPIKAGNSRRTALLSILSITHPDIYDFLDAKIKQGALHNSNISVKIPDTLDFIKAIQNNKEIQLVWKGKYKKDISAKDLWDKIIYNAYHFAEPGLLNWELIEKENTISYIKKLTSPNPCFTADTLIWTKNGSYRIIDLIGKTVELWDGRQWVLVDNFRKTAVTQELMQIYLSNGQTLRCTKYHEFILSDGKIIEAQRLLVGDILMKNNSPNYSQISEEIKATNIDFGGYEDVYCCTIPTTHQMQLTAGIMVRQCSELILTENESCCLGSLVLPRFISNNEIDYEQLGKTIHTSVRFLDNVHTVNHYPMKEMEVVAHSLRRIGLGVTGLADMLIILGYKYGSEESLKFLNKLFRFISKQAYESSIMLAIEKGMFPLCNPKLHANTGFVAKMTTKVRSLIEEHGIRNCALLSIAPTGSISLLSGNCSSGIEPIYSAAYERRYWNGDERKVETVLHPLFKEYMDEGKDTSNFIGAKDLTLCQHLDIQKTIQNHIDNSLSKSINLSENFSIEELSDTLLEYLPFIKGTTVFRENSRMFVNPKSGELEEPPLKSIPLKEAIQRYDTKLNISYLEDKCRSGVCEL